MYIAFIQSVFQNLIDAPLLFQVAIGIGVAITLAYSILTKVLPKQFLVPPHDWIDKIVTALNSDKTSPKLVSGTKTGSIRRRLVIGALRPSLYSTTAQIDTLRIAPCDKDVANQVQFLTNCKIKRPDDETRRKLYGIFHPYCNSGGGGEKVMWELVRRILQQDRNGVCVIYHGEKTATPKDILLNVGRIFHLNDLPSDRIVFIYLSHVHWLDPKTWPVFTLVGQALGTVFLSLEAMYKLSPDIWIDTVGLPFSYPFVGAVLKIPILSYTHFPVIQSEMLAKLNKKSVFQLGKYVYWYIFLMLYKLCGIFVSLVLVNSTWTYDHMVKIWNLEEGRIVKCYPICSPELLLAKQEAEAERGFKRSKTVVSLSQFRDEKRHDLILQEYAKYLEAVKGNTNHNNDEPYKLKLIGSIRTEKDMMKVESLKKLVTDLQIPEDHVQFLINLQYESLIEELVSAEVGLNAMWNEHFGIVVVEYLAAGLIPLVHASAGPYLDIVIPWDNAKHEQAPEGNTSSSRTGFHFKSDQDPDSHNQTDKTSFPTLHESLIEIENLNEIEKTAIRTRARDLVEKRFSNQLFYKIIDESLKYVNELEVFLRVDKRDKVEQMY